MTRGSCRTAQQSSRSGAASPLTLLLNMSQGPLDSDCARDLAPQAACGPCRFVVRRLGLTSSIVASTNLNLSHISRQQTGVWSRIFTPQCKRASDCAYTYHRPMASSQPDDPNDDDVEQMRIAVSDGDMPCVMHLVEKDPRLVEFTGSGFGFTALSWAALR